MMVAAAHPVPRLAAAAAAVALITAAACSDAPRLTAPSTIGIAPVAQIQDAPRGGDPHFYWLPPIAPATSYGGTFDGALDPELRICRFASGACAAQPTVYKRTSSPAITVSATAQSYSFTWSTSTASITTGDYRAEVWIAGRKLGFADARVGANAKELKNLPPDYAGVQRGKSLVFAFRLEAGIVASVSVAPQHPSIEAGATVQLVATVRDFHGAALGGAPVSWSSASASVATVNATGLVTGVAPGTTIVTASSSGVFGIDTILVAQPRVDQVVVNPSGESVAAGDTVRLWATTYDARGNILTGRALAWSSSDPAVATVSSSGLVTGVVPGAVTITATSEGVAGGTSVTVTSPPVERVAVSPKSVSLTVGASTQLSATTYDAADHALTGRVLTWTASDTTVAVVAPNGMVTATGPGLSSVIAESEGKVDSAFIDVTGATVTCVRPWALPNLWFIAGIYGRAVTAHYGVMFGTEFQGTISGYYYPVAIGGSGATTYTQNIRVCPTTPITLGAPTPRAVGNLVGPTITGLDALFAQDPNASWDDSANGGQGGIVGSSASAGEESARVVQVGLYEPSDNSPGSSSVRFRRTAWVFIERYARVADPNTGALKADITFRFLRFGE